MGIATGVLQKGKDLSRSGLLTRAQGEFMRTWGAQRRAHIMPDISDKAFLYDHFQHTCRACSPCSAAAVISDAAAGGQVLLDSATFALIKDITGDLGHMTHEGPRFSRTGWTFGNWW